MIKVGLKSLSALAGATVFAGALAAGTALADGHLKTYPAPEGHPLDEIISGYEFRTAETKAVQDDDFENPGFLWVEKGADLWSQVDGKAGKSCQTCHDDASDSMAKTGAEFPKWNAKLGKPQNLEQQINLCRTTQMDAEAWKWESDQLLSMTAFVRHQSNGVPVVGSTDGNMKEWADRGKEIYYGRVGQLDMACSNCHEDNYGVNIRSDMLSQGQSNGFPTYRFKWQKLGSLHRRFKGCMKNIRATPYKVGSDEFLALEVYLAYRGIGLPVEAPAVRN